MSKKLRLLIIEDSEDDTLLIVRELKRGGYQPVWLRIETADELKKALEEQEWDIILSDYKMPKFSGLDALKRVQETKLEIPFIIISGTIGEETAVRVMQAGAYDYIVKDKIRLVVPAVERGLREAENRKGRRTAKEALDRSERLTRSIVESAPIGILYLDADGIITYENPAMRRMMGVPDDAPSPVEGKKISDLPPFKASGIREEYRALMRGETVYGKVVRWKSIMGPERDLEVYGAPILSEEERVEGAIIMSSDITEKRRAEEALRENERFLQDVFDGIQDGICVLDTDRNIIRTNIWMEKMYKSRMPLVGKKCHSAYQGRDDICSWCPSSTQDAERVHTHTAPYPSAENPEGWMQVSSYPLKDVSGRIVGIIEHLKNITDQKRAEEALKESEEKFRTLAEQSPNMIFINKTGKIVYTNQRSVEIMGYSKAELCSPDFDFMSLIAPESKELIRKMYDLHRRGENVPPYEYIILTKSGKRIHAINSSQIIPYEGEPAILGVITDITIQKKSEGALKESEEKYRNLIEQSNDAIYLLFDDRFEIINRRFTDIFGYTLEETNVPEFNFRKLLAPESLPIIEERMKRLSQGKAPDPVYEFTALTKSGKRIECETGVTYIEYKGGLATQGIIRDITGRKRAEAMIKASLQEKEILLREIHHRVKNNLQIISSLLNLQADQVEDETALKAFQNSRSRVHSMALVHERLYKSEDFARIDFRGYVESMIKNLFHTYRTGENVNLELDIQDITLTIDTAIPCGLILNEMISNSLKHAFPQGSNGNIRITLNKTGKGTYRLVFSDDGVGLPESFDIGKAESLGLKLIQILTSQIDGTLEIRRDRGTTYVIAFRSENT